VPVAKTSIDFIVLMCFTLYYGK